MVDESKDDLVLLAQELYVTMQLVPVKHEVDGTDK